MPTIVSPEDNGNIVVKNADNPLDIHLDIRGDNESPDKFQWFNFKLEGALGEKHVLYFFGGSACFVSGTSLLGY